MLPLPLDLGHLRHQEAHFIAVEFSDGGNTVDVSDGFFWIFVAQFFMVLG